MAQKKSNDRRKKSNNYPRWEEVKKEIKPIGRPAPRIKRKPSLPANLFPVDKS